MKANPHAHGKRQPNGAARQTAAKELGDFTTDTRVIPISLVAIAIGAAQRIRRLGLLRLIGLFTNLFYFGRWSTQMVSPAGNHLGAWAIAPPVAGALIIGLMARYGSERIRGHGIPEALEAILINGSKVQPRLALLKPLASAISIGSGGPFGAEGPIIMTGGAFGSLIAQFLHLTNAERKTLLVAGAAAACRRRSPPRWPRLCLPWSCCSSSGSRGALFRWLWPVRRRPRSTLHHWPRPAVSRSAACALIGPRGLLGCVLVGLAAGAVSAC